MKRIVSWCVCVVVLVVVFKGAAAIGNPWSAEKVFAPALPASGALWIPGCGDKPGCLL